MFIARVVGTLWATQKTENTSGMKFLIVQRLNFTNGTAPDSLVVADVLGAGEGELVMIATGRAARIAVGNEDMSIESAVTAIIDEYALKPEHYNGEVDPDKISYKKEV